MYFLKVLEKMGGDGIGLGLIRIEKTGVLRPASLIYCLCIYAPLSIDIN